MDKKSIVNNRIFWIAGLTLLTALILVALNSYRELARRDRIDGIDQLLTPLKPELNDEVLSTIEKRKEYQLEEVNELLKSEPTVIPTPELSPVESEESDESTPSGEPNLTITSTPNATDSGELND
jgi:hypothetical protein